MLTPALQAAVPQILNHQGRIAVDGINFDGTGQFKFALVDATGNTTFWSNDGTSNAGSQPTAAVSLSVVRGLYSVLLGDASLPNMTAVPAAVFANTNVRLRVWFNDGSHGFQLISPDQRLAASPYALAAENAALATSFSGSLAGDVSGTQSATSIAAPTVTGKLLTGYVSGAGSLLSADDTILSAFNKLDGNSKLKANLDSPTFTGMVEGTFSGPLTGNVTGNVSGSAATFTGSLSGDVTGTQSATAISATTVTGKVLTNYASTTGTINATDTILSAINKLNGNNALKANLASPTFTGTVRLPTGTASAAPLRLATGVSLTTPVFGSVEFDGTNLLLTNNAGSPTRKTLAFTDAPTFSGTTSGTFSGPLTGNVTGNVSGSAASFTGSLSGDVTGNQGSTVISAATVTGKALTGYSSAAGTISATDTILTAINKLNGNDALKANLASPTFTGTVSGITASMVGLGNVNNTSDENKPVSSAQQAALDLKASLASPTFTGTVLLPTGTASSAPLRLATGVNLTTPVFGSVEFDGTNLLLTNNSASPTRKTLAFTDAPTFTGVPLAPTASSGTNTDQIATTQFVQSAIQGVVGAAPAALDTLNELAEALNDDASYASTITNALSLKAPIASPTFTGTVTGTFSGNVTGNVTGNVSGSAASFTGSLSGDVTGNQGSTAISATTVTGKALTGYSSTTGTINATDTILSAINKLNGNDALKANLASPTFTGTVSGITASMVGLGNVNNTSDANKPVSSAQQAALNLKANLASPTFTGTVQLPTGTASAAPLKLATGVNLTTPVFGSVEFDGTNLFLTNNSASPTRKTLAFTDAPTLTGVPLAPTAAAGTNTSQIATTQFVQSAIQGVVGAAPAALDTLNELAVALNNDASYASTITTALSLKAPLASPTFTGTTTGTFSGPLTGNVTGNVSGSAATFTGTLAGDVTGTQSATAISAITVTGKSLTGYVSGAGTISATDTILTAINKLNGNDALKANLASPTFTGTVGGITASMVGLGNVSNTSDANKPVSTAQQAALDLKASLANPTFTGTVSGITKTMVGLGSVNNTSDANKPVSTAQQAALDLKANLASPTFSGTVSLPAGTAFSAPMKLTAGANLASASFGAVEFDGSNLYLTTNSASPTRKTLAFSDSVPTTVPAANLTTAPIVPVLAWGNNRNSQTTMPALANVAAVAAGESHSLVLLDSGTVIAQGLNTRGQVTVPVGLTGVTEIAAGASHNIVRKSDGTLVAWGDNSYGQTTLPSGITTATRVAAGEKHSLALLANGSVRAWGDNSFGQTTLPASLTGATITAIAAGSDHSLALKSDGTVIAWGRDDAAQVTLPSGLVNVVAIAAGAYHSLALKSDGTVIAWGWDSGGQVTVPAGLSGVSKIAGGYAFSMALKTDGTLVLWGDNTDGQTTIPTSATKVTHIAAGASHALALRADAIPAQVALLDQDNVFTGKVGIKRTPAVNSLEVEGSASKTTAGSWLSNSDRRIKTEIQSITGALQKLDQVRLVDFRYTDEYRAVHPSIADVRYPNVIAQEFAEVFPDDVKNSGEVMADGSPILQVDTYPLIIYSAAAVQELNQENQKLKKQLVNQEKQLADQEKRLRKLEALLGE